MVLMFGLLGLRPVLADMQCGQGMDGRRSVASRVEDMRRAARLWPVQSEYRRRLAIALAEAGDTRQAEAILREILALRPNDPDLYALLGDIYKQKNTRDPRLWRSAEDEYRRAIDIAPNVATYNVALSTALAAQGRVEEAIVALERAVALDATNAAAYGYLAKLYRNAGRQKEARQAEEAAKRWSAP